ncbi:MAG: GguC protein, partial [Acidobacteriaceae bacterium]
FKFELHRRPGDVHIHFLGAHSLSFGDGVRLKDGDGMEVSFEGFGRTLRNPVMVEARAERPVGVRSLG